MKIGVDIRVLLDKNYSGVAGFTFNLLKNLIRIDKYNAYYFFYNSFSSKIDLVEFKNINNNLQIIKTNYPNKIFNYFFQKIFNYPKLDKVVGGCTVFYCPHINFSSFSSNSKNIITIHDLSFLRYKEFFSQRKNFWHRAINIKKNIKKFDKIIAVSHNTKNDLVELLKVPSEKIEVIYPGLPELKFDSNLSPDYLLEKYNINKDYVLYLGNIEPRKNINTLISAYNLLRASGQDVSLVLAGGWGWKTKKIKQKWQESPYKKDIIFTGYVRDEVKPLLYQKARVFAYPSFYEGFGFPPLEAMSFGLPVVSSNVSSLPEVLGDSALYINPDRPEELSEALKNVLQDQDLRQRLINSGYNQIKKFSWEKTSQDYLKIINEK